MSYISKRGRGTQDECSDPLLIGEIFKKPYLTYSPLLLLSVYRSDAWKNIHSTHNLETCIRYPNEVSWYCKKHNSLRSITLPGTDLSTHIVGRVLFPAGSAEIQCSCYLRV